MSASSPGYCERGKPVVLELDHRTAFRTTLFAVQISSFVFPILVALLTPGGRRGKLRTEKFCFHRGATMAGAAELYAQRLLALGFSVDPPRTPRLITARRKKSKEAEGPLAVHTMSGKPLNAEIHLDEQPGGVGSQIAVWTPDYVLKDTGEGTYIQGVVDEIAGEPVASTPPVPNPSFNATAAIWCAALIWIASIVFVTLNLNPGQVRGMAMGLFANTAICVVIAGLGVRQTFVKPQEITGRETAYAAIVLALAAAAFVAFSMKQLLGGGAG